MTCDNCCDYTYCDKTTTKPFFTPMARLWFFLSLIAISILLVSCHITWDRNTRIKDLSKDDVQEFLDFQRWKHLKSGLEVENTLKNPPSPQNPVLMARFIVNQADWSAVATISTRNDINSYPYASVVSISDGPLGNGAGIPYMTLSPLSATAKNLEQDPRATMMMTLAEGDFCQKHNMDPQDPRCARIDMTGRIVKISESDFDYNIAKNAVYGRHPWLAHMPPDHHFFLAKLDIQSIAVLDAFGGAKYLTLDEYLHPPLENSDKRSELDFESILLRRIYKV